MSTPLLDLERDLAHACDGNRAEEVQSIREQIVTHHPTTHAAADAAYRLGLHALFSRGDLDKAAEHFRHAAKVKGATIVQAARTSLALVLVRQGKPQQAVFELRKAAAQQPLNLAAAQAQGFMMTILRQTGPMAELERSKSTLLRMLDELTRRPDVAEASVAHLMLAAEYRAEGARDRAKRHLLLALEKGLDSEHKAWAEATLADLS